MFTTHTRTCHYFAGMLEIVREIFEVKSGSGSLLRLLILHLVMIDTSQCLQC